MKHFLSRFLLLAIVSFVRMNLSGDTSLGVVVASANRKRMDKCFSGKI